MKQILRLETCFEEIAEQVRELSEIKIVFYKLSMCIRHSLNEFPPHELKK